VQYAGTLLTKPTLVQVLLVFCHMKRRQYIVCLSVAPISLSKMPVKIIIIFFNITMLVKCLRCQTILFDIRMQIACSVYKPYILFRFYRPTACRFQSNQNSVFASFRKFRNQVGCPNFQLSQLTEPLGDVLT